MGDKKYSCIWIDELDDGYIETEISRLSMDLGVDASLTLWPVPEETAPEEEVVDEEVVDEEVTEDEEAEEDNAAKLALAASATLAMATLF